MEGWRSRTAAAALLLLAAACTRGTVVTTTQPADATVPAAIAGQSKGVGPSTGPTSAGQDLTAVASSPTTLRPAIVGTVTLPTPADYRNAAGIHGTAVAETAAFSWTGTDEFTQLSDGSYHTITSQASGGPCETAYDAASMTYLATCPPSEQDNEGYLAAWTGLPSAGMNVSRERELFSIGITPYEGLFARALEVAATGVPATGVKESSLVLRTDPESPNAVGIGEVVLTISADVALGMPLRVVEEQRQPQDGEPYTMVWELTSLELLAEPTDIGSVAAELAARDSGRRVEFFYGFRRSTVAEVAALSDYAPVHLGPTAPGGLALTDVFFADETPLLVHPSNPNSVQVAVFVYRRGMETLTVTNRLLGVTIEGVPSEGIPDRAAGADDWDDPFNIGGWSTGRVTIGAPAGPMSPVIADLGIAPHSWGVVGDAVVTVEGNVAPHLLSSAASILGREPK